MSSDVGEAMTTLFDLAPIGGLTIGLLAGHAVGSRFGTIPGMVGAALCGGVGFWAARLLILLPLWWLDRDPLKRKTTEQLRRSLRDPELANPTGVLLELGARGENLSNHLSLVIEQLGSPLQETRNRAFHALRVVWPSVATLVSDFRAEEGPDECQRKADRLRRANPSTAPNGGPATSSVTQLSGKDRHR